MIVYYSYKVINFFFIPILSLLLFLYLFSSLACSLSFFYHFFFLFSSDSNLFFFSLSTLSFVVIMGFVASCGSSGDRFCGNRFCDRLWVVGFNVILCLVVVVAVASGVRFLWPIVWVCRVFVASCAGGFVGFLW